MARRCRHDSQPSPNTRAAVPRCAAALLLLLLAGPARALDAPQAPAAGSGEGQGVFVTDFLAEAAHHFARRLAGVPGRTLPAAVTYLQDVDGRPSAFVAVYRLGGEGALQPGVLTGGLNQATGAVLGAMSGHDGAGLHRELRALRGGGDYLTVIVGASPLGPKLISLSEGLPPHVFAELGRTLVARKAGVEPSAVRVGAPVVTPDMPRGMDLGFTYEASGAPYLYLLPGASHPEGEVLQASAYRSLRQRLEVSAAREILLARGEPADEVTPETARRTLNGSRLANARSWGRLAASLGHAGTAVLCAGCSPEESEAILAGGLLHAPPAHVSTADVHEGCTADTTGAAKESGVVAVGPHALGAADDENTVCECYRELGNLCAYPNSTYAVDSCDDFDKEEDCCDYGALAYDEEERCYELESVMDFCHVGCHCDCKHYYTLEDVDFGGLYLRGVPTLYQHRMYGTSWLCDEKQIWSGCGAVAGVELLSWFDMLGASELGDDYRDGLALDWQALVEDMRSGDYLDSEKCGGGTTASGVRKGLQAYFDDQGIVAEVDTEKLRHGDESEHESLFHRIKESIGEYRPVGLSYGALGDVPDENHIALITGYFEEHGEPYIYVNTGWGAGDNEIYEFEVASGNIHLHFVETSLASAAGSLMTPERQWCAADSMSDYFLDASDTTYTMSDSSHDETEYDLGGGYHTDDLPIYEEILPCVSDTCALLGGVGDYVGYTRSSEQIDCVETLPRMTPLEEMARDFSVLVEDIPYRVEEIFVDFYEVRIYTPFPTY